MLKTEVASGLEPLCPVLQTGASKRPFVFSGAKLLLFFDLCNFIGTFFRRILLGLITDIL